MRCYRGEYHVRSGSTKQELKGAALDRFLLRKHGRTWDGVPVPEDALRVALLNALIHRDYSSYAPVQIRVYPDKLRMWNSAVLPEGWDAEKLMGDHPSRPFNPFVAATFFRAGEIEAWGRGIQRIFAACEGAGAPSPGIRCDAGDFWLEFPFAGSYVEAVLGVSTPQVTTEVTTEVTLLAALRGEMSREQKYRLTEKGRTVLAAARKRVSSS